MTRTKESEPRIWKSPSFEECAVEILKEAGEPLHYREILRRVLEKRPVGGKTPQNTAYSVLTKSKRFIRVSKGGIFDLAEKSAEISDSQDIISNA